MMPIKMKNFLFDSLDIGLNILIVSEQGMDRDYLYQDLMWDFHGKEGARVLISSPNEQVPEIPDCIRALKATRKGDAERLMRLALSMNPDYIFSDGMDFCATELLQAMQLDTSIVAITDSFSTVVESAAKNLTHLSHAQIEKLYCQHIDLMVRITNNEFFLGFPWYDQETNGMRFKLLLKSKDRETWCFKTELKPSIVKKVQTYTAWYLDQANR